VLVHLLLVHLLLLPLPPLLLLQHRRLEASERLGLRCLLMG
jgi:hypothetical protein